MRKKNVLLAMKPGEVKTFEISKICEAYESFYITEPVEPVGRYNETRWVLLANGAHVLNDGEKPDDNSEVALSPDELATVLESDYVGHSRTGAEDDSVFGGPMYYVRRLGFGGGFYFGFFTLGGSVRAASSEAGWGPGGGHFCGVDGTTLVTVVRRDKGLCLDRRKKVQ